MSSPYGRIKQELIAAIRACQESATPEEYSTEPMPLLLDDLKRIRRNTRLTKKWSKQARLFEMYSIGKALMEVSFEEARNLYSELNIRPRDRGNYKNIFRLFRRHPEAIWNYQPVFKDFRHLTYPLAARIEQEAYEETLIHSATEWNTLEELFSLLTDPNEIPEFTDLETSSDSNLSVYPNNTD